MSACPARAAMTDLPLALAMGGQSMAAGYDERLAYANKHRRLRIAVTGAELARAANAPLIRSYDSP